MKKIFKQLAAVSLAAALITAGNAALPATTGIPSASAAETGIVTIDESGTAGGESDRLHGGTGGERRDHGERRVHRFHHAAVPGETRPLYQYRIHREYQSTAQV